MKTEKQPRIYTDDTDEYESEDSRSLFGRYDILRIDLWRYSGNGADGCAADSGDSAGHRVVSGAVAGIALDADLGLMQKAGIHMVRVGEFAWSRMEPTDGQYDLDWLDRAITAAAKHGIVTVIGTPSAAPPAWLTQKYPETLRTMQDGRKDQHGNRQQFNFANPKYRELARAMAEQLAKRFGHNPNVVDGKSIMSTPKSRSIPRPGSNFSSGSNSATARSTTSTLAGPRRIGSAKPTSIGTRCRFRLATATPGCC